MAHATPADLAAYVDPDLLADQTTANLTRLLGRASAAVDDLITEEPEPSVLADLDALRRATLLTVEHVLTVGEAATVTGGGISIGHVSITADATTGGRMSNSALPDSAVRVLRAAGLIQPAIGSAW